MALYGHEITASINPFEAGLGRIVKFDKGDFVGRAKLAEARDKGLTRSLTGFEMTTRGIGRDGYEINIGGLPAGWVTSGGPSPTLNKNIGAVLSAGGSHPAGAAHRNHHPQHAHRGCGAPYSFLQTSELRHVSGNIPLYQGTRVGSRRRRHGNHRYHLSCAKELGDIVYVDLPKAGAEIEQGKTIGSVESVKAVSDIYSPVTGEVLEVNDELSESPEKLNEDPTRHGVAGEGSPVQAGRDQRPHELRRLSGLHRRIGSGNTCGRH